MIDSSAPATTSLTPPETSGSVLATVFITERVAKQIAALRSERKLSQEALAAKAGINRVTLARIELAVHQPTLDTLDAIARALGVRLVDLIEPKLRRRR